MDNYLKGMVEELAENLEKPWPGPEDIVRMRGKEQKEQIAESMRKSWRDCCDCKHEREIETASCHVCSRIDARPHWERKEPLKPTREYWEKWVDSMPLVCDFGTYKAFEDWLRNMPEIPKE